jgi:hypothetical protein
MRLVTDAIQMLALKLLTMTVEGLFAFGLTLSSPS